MMAVEKGCVKWFNSEKGFGFIERNQGADVFVHHNDIVGRTTLQEKQQVEFGVTQGKKGLQAVNVTVVDA